MKPISFGIVLTILGIANHGILTASESPVLMKILQAVDVATSGEHLFDVTLQLLKSVCACMRKTLQAREAKVLFDSETNFIQVDEQHDSTKDLDLYRKIYNNTCFNLRQELSAKLSKTNADKDNEVLSNVTNFSKSHNSSDTNIITNSQLTTTIEDVLHKVLIQNRDFHNYTIEWNNVFRQTNTFNLSKRSIILIITLYRKDKVKKSKLIDENVLDDTLNSSYPIEIDIITMHNHQKVSENSVKSCHLDSIYAYFSQREVQNKTNVFKLLGKHNAIKIYIDAEGSKDDFDFISTCCNNKTFVKWCIGKRNNNNINVNYVKYQGIQNYKDTISKIKNLVKLYDAKINEDKSNNLGMGGLSNTDSECIRTATSDHKIAENPFESTLHISEIFQQSSKNKNENGEKSQSQSNYAVNLLRQEPWSIYQSNDQNLALERNSPPNLKLKEDEYSAIIDDGYNMPSQNIHKNTIKTKYNNSKRAFEQLKSSFNKNEIVPLYSSKEGRRNINISQNIQDNMLQNETITFSYNEITYHGNLTAANTGNETTTSYDGVVNITSDNASTMTIDNELKSNASNTTSTTAFMDQITLFSINDTTVFFHNMTTNANETITSSKEITFTSGYETTVSSFDSTSAGSETMKTSGYKTIVAFGNKTTLTAGNETTMAIGNETTMASGDETTMATGNEVTTAIGNGTTPVSGHETIMASGNETSMASGNETVMASGNETATISSDESTMDSGNETVMTFSKEPTMASDNKTAKTTGNETTIASGNETATMSGSEMTVASGNETNTTSGSKTIAVSGNKTTMALGEETITMASNETPMAFDSETTTTSNVSNKAAGNEANIGFENDTKSLENEIISYGIVTTTSSKKAIAPGNKTTYYKNEPTPSDHPSIDALTTFQSSTNTSNSKTPKTSASETKASGSLTITLTNETAKATNGQLTTSGSWTTFGEKTITYANEAKTNITKVSAVGTAITASSKTETSSSFKITSSNETTNSANKTATTPFSKTLVTIIESPMSDSKTITFTRKTTTTLADTMAAAFSSEKISFSSLTATPGNITKIYNNKPLSYTSKTAKTSVSVIKTTTNEPETNKRVTSYTNPTTTNSASKFNANLTTAFGSLTKILLKETSTTFASETAANSYLTTTSIHGTSNPTDALTTTQRLTKNSASETATASVNKTTASGILAVTLTNKIEAAFVSSIDETSNSTVASTTSDRSTTTSSDEKATASVYGKLPSGSLITTFDFETFANKGKSSTSETKILIDETVSMSGSEITPFGSLTATLTNETITTGDITTTSSYETTITSANETVSCGSLTAMLTSKSQNTGNGTTITANETAMVLASEKIASSGLTAELVNNTATTSYIKKTLSNETATKSASETAKSDNLTTTLTNEMETTGIITTTISGETATASASKTETYDSLITIPDEMVTTGILTITPSNEIATMHDSETTASISLTANLTSEIAATGDVTTITADVVSTISAFDLTASGSFTTTLVNGTPISGNTIPISADESATTSTSEIRASGNFTTTFTNDTAITYNITTISSDEKSTVISAITSSFHKRTASDNIANTTDNDKTSSYGDKTTMTVGNQIKSGSETTIDSRNETTSYDDKITFSTMVGSTTEPHTTSSNTKQPTTVVTVASLSTVEKPTITSYANKIEELMTDSVASNATYLSKTTSVKKCSRGYSTSKTIVVGSITETHSTSTTTSSAIKKLEANDNNAIKKEPTATLSNATQKSKKKCTKDYFNNKTVSSSTSKNLANATISTTTEKPTTVNIVGSSISPSFTAGLLVSSIPSSSEETNKTFTLDPIKTSSNITVKCTAKSSASTDALFKTSNNQLNSKWKMLVRSLTAAFALNTTAHDHEDLVKRITTGSEVMALTTAHPRNVFAAQDFYQENTPVTQNISSYPRILGARGQSIATKVKDSSLLNKIEKIKKVTALPEIVSYSSIIGTEVQVIPRNNSNKSMRSSYISTNLPATLSLVTEPTVDIRQIRKKIKIHVLDVNRATKPEKTIDTSNSFQAKNIHTAPELSTNKNILTNKLNRTATSKNPPKDPNDYNTSKNNVLKNIFSAQTTDTIKGKTIKYNTYQPNTGEELDISMKLGYKLTSSHKNHLKKISKEKNITRSRPKTTKLRSQMKYRRTTRTMKYTTVTNFPKSTTMEEFIKKQTVTNTSPTTSQAKYNRRDFNMNLRSRIVTKNFRSLKNLESNLLDPFTKTNMYPLKMMSPLTQRKVMNRIQMTNRNEIQSKLFSPFSMSKVIPQRPYMMPTRIHKPVTSIPRQVILRPKFDIMDKSYFHNMKYFWPKPILLQKDEDFFRDEFKATHHLNSMTRRKKVNFVQEALRNQFTHPENQDQNNIEMPSYLPPVLEKPRFLRDRIHSIRNYVSDYVKPTTKKDIWKEYFLERQEDVEDEYNLNPSLLFYKRSYPEPTVSTVVTARTKRKGRTLFFYSPTVPYNRYF